MLVHILLRQQVPAAAAFQNHSLLKPPLFYSKKTCAFKIVKLYPHRGARPVTTCIACSKKTAVVRKPHVIKSSERKNLAVRSLFAGGGLHGDFGALGEVQLINCLRRKYPSPKAVHPDQSAPRGRKRRIKGARIIHPRITL